MKLNDEELRRLDAMLAAMPQPPVAPAGSVPAGLSLAALIELRRARLAKHR